MTTTALPTIAFLGIGLMGKPMATRLRLAGYPLTVWNRSADKTTALIALGAVGAKSAMAAVHAADIVITMLDSGPIFKEVLAAALAGIKTGALVIDMSSTAQDEAVAIGRLVADHGANFLDAPVSGGFIGAEQGTLAIMAGGSVDSYALAEPVFRVLGRPTRVGEIGSGQLAKLCNQLIVGGTIAIVAEALLLAQAGGADPAAVRAALRGGFAESRILEVHGQRMLERNFVPGGQIKSQAKDMRNVVRAAAACELRLPLGELLTAFYADIEKTLPQADQAAALLGLEARNPGKRVGDGADQLPGRAAT